MKGALAKMMKPSHVTSKFNFPLLMFMVMLIFALVAFPTVRLKPPLIFPIFAVFAIGLLFSRATLRKNLKVLSISSIILILLLLASPPLKAAVITEYNLSAGSSPIDITLDDDSNIWFTEYGLDRIGKITQGTNKIEEFILASGSKPWGIAYVKDANDLIWFTEYSNHKIGVIIESPGPAYSLIEFSLISDFPGPKGITVDENKDVWFTETNIGAIGKLENPLDAANRKVMEWFLPDSNAQPLSIIYAEGKLWFTEYQGDRIGCFDPALGRLEEWPLIPGSRPWGISRDSYGNIWFTESGRDRIAKLNPYTNEITEYAVPTPGSGLRDITVDKYNNVWFVEHDANKIGRFTPGSNLIAEFERSGGAPTGVTYDSNENIIWFTDEAGDRICRLDPTKAVTTTTVSTLLRAPTSSSTATTIGSSTMTSSQSSVGAAVSTSSITVTADGALTSTTMSTTSYTISETSSLLRTSSVATSITYATYSATTTVTSTSYYTTVLATTEVTYTVTKIETSTISTTVITAIPTYVATVTATSTSTRTITITTTTTVLPFTLQVPSKPLENSFGASPIMVAIGALALTLMSMKFSRKRSRFVAIIGVAMLAILLASNVAKAAVITEWSLPPDSTLPYEITFDDQSPYRVWFTENGGHKIGRLNHITGEIFEIRLPSGSRPWGIAFETARKEIWFSMAGRCSIGVISDYGAGSVKEIPILGGAYAEGPRGLTIQEHVNGTDYPYIWFTVFGANKIGRLDPYYKGRITYWDLKDGSGPQSIIFVHDTGVWFTAYAGQYIGNLNPATGELKEWDISPGRPWDLTADQFGNIWFTDPDQDRIGKLNPYSGEIIFYKIPTSLSNPYSIIVDNQNFVWFTEHGQNRIGRFSPDDLTFVEFVRSASGAPWGLALSPDNKIWFTDDAVSKVCRLDPSTALATTTVSTISTASKTTTTLSPAFSTASSTTATTTLSDVATTLTSAPASTTTTYGATETVEVLQVTSTSEVISYSTETIIVLGTSTTYSPTTVATTTQTETTVKILTSVSTSFSPATKTVTKIVTTNTTVTITAETTPPLVIPGYQPLTIMLGITSGVALLFAINVYRRFKRKT